MKKRTVGASPLDFAEINRLHVDLVGVHQMDEASGGWAHFPGCPNAEILADCDRVQLGWVDARLDAYEKLHPGAASITEEKASAALFGTLAELRYTCTKERELAKALARAADLPTVAGPNSQLQRKAIPQVQSGKRLLRKALAGQMTEHAYIRSKGARDLLRQGHGDFGVQRLPIDPTAGEPFLHRALLSAADRSSLRLFCRPVPSAAGEEEGKVARHSKFDLGHAATAAARLAFKKKAHDELVEIDESNGFSIMLRITTAKFLERLQDAMLSTWHDAAAEKAACLDGLPCYNHQLLPLLCTTTFDAPEFRVQLKMPPTIVFIGNTCTNFIENTEPWEHLGQKVSMEGVPAVGMEWELRRLAPFSGWGMRHGSFVAKRLFVNGQGEDLSYVCAAGRKSVCMSSCVPPHARHKAESLGSFHATAIPPTAEDLMVYAHTHTHTQLDTQKHTHTPTTEGWN
jgi:hypothetical protein